LDYAIVFAIGINDTLHLNDDYESTPEKYNQELELLLYKTKQLTARIAFLNLLPVDEKLNNKDTTKDGRYYTNRRIELFNNVLEKFCIDNKLALINVRKLFTDNYALLSSDGTHPNTKGHEAIYTSVMPTIKSWLYEQ
jgi:lysophospholipase L1-like esterase